MAEPAGVCDDQPLPREADGIPNGRCSHRDLEAEYCVSVIGDTTVQAINQQRFHEGQAGASWLNVNARSAEVVTCDAR